jgi:hypothetical protein
VWNWFNCIRTGLVVGSVKIRMDLLFPQKLRNYQILDLRTGYILHKFVWRIHIYVIVSWLSFGKGRKLANEIIMVPLHTLLPAFETVDHFSRKWKLCNWGHTRRRTFQLGRNSNNEYRAKFSSDFIQAAISNESLELRMWSVMRKEIINIGRTYTLFSKYCL